MRVDAATTTTPLINRSHSGAPYSRVNLHGANIIMIIVMTPIRTIISIIILILIRTGCRGHIFVYFDLCDAKN